MRRASLFLSIFFLSQASAEWSDCPSDIKGRTLTSWRDTLVSRILEGQGAEANQAVERCFGTNIPACYQDMMYSARPDNPVSAERIPYSREELTIDYNDLPAEFRSRDGQVQIPENIESVGRQRGWKVLSYKTRSTGGFDTPPNLLMMAISSPEREIILQTQTHPDIDPSASLNNPTPQPANGNLSEGQATLTVITVDKTTNPPVGQMRIMRKQGNGYVWNNEIQISECTSCHTTPLRPISPIGYQNVNGDEQRMTPEQTRTTDELNAILSSYVSWGKRNFNGREVRLGPPMQSFPTGWAPENSPTRQEEFLRRCATRNREFTYSGFGGYNVSYQQGDNINYGRLSQAMNCIECHNDFNRGRLHESYSAEEIDFKVVVDRSMPHNMSELTTDERIALVSCLDSERDALRDQWYQSGAWMKNSSCFGKQFKTPPTLPLNQTRVAPAPSGSRTLAQ